MSGETPRGWREAKLGDLCRIEIGGTPSRDKPEFWSNEIDGHPWVSIADLKTTSVDCTKEFISDLGVAKSNVKPVPRGTVMMSFKLTIGRTAVAGCDLYTNEAIAAFFPERELENEFLFYALPHAVGRAEPDQAIKGATLNKAKLRDLTIVLPPLDEQRRIAEVLRSVSDGVAASDAALQATTSVRQATLDSIMRKETVPADFSPLASVAEVRTGLAKNAGREGVKVSLPYLRVANVQDGWIDLADVKSVDVDPGAVSRYSLQKGDVLLTEGGDYDKLGRGGVWGGKIEPCLHQNHVFAVRPDQTKLSSDFLALLTQSYLGRTYFLSCAKRTTNLASINSSQLKNLPVPKLPLKRQQEIVSEVGSIDRVISIEKERRDATRRLQRALSSDLLSGRVRVPA